MRLDCGWPIRGATFIHMMRIVKFAVRNRVRTIFPVPRLVSGGGLMAYGTNKYRQVATYVDKILRGAKPADLPVEQPSRALSASAAPK